MAGPEQQQQPTKRPSPLSLRLTPEERARLERNAGGQPLGAYIKAVLFADGAPVIRTRRKPARDELALAELLARLGASRIANNLNQLARAAHVGALAGDADAREALLTACADVQAMRTLLMQALGIGAEVARKPRKVTAQAQETAPEPIEADATPQKEEVPLPLTFGQAASGKRFRL